MRKRNRLCRAVSALAATVAMTCGLTSYAADETASPIIGAVGVRIPAEAKKATLEVSERGELTLNGQPARMSAGGQIRGTNNLIVLSQSLRGEYPVRVLLDGAGQINRAWIIGPAQ